jgi:hypothetical protein
VRGQPICCCQVLRSAAQFCSSPRSGLQRASLVPLTATFLYPTTLNSSATQILHALHTPTLEHQASLLQGDTFFKPNNNPISLKVCQRSSRRLLFVLCKADRSQTTNRTMPPKAAAAITHNLTNREVELLAAMATLMGDVPNVSLFSIPDLLQSTNTLCEPAFSPSAPCHTCSRSHFESQMDLEHLISPAPYHFLIF